MHPLLDGKRLIAFDLDGTLIDSVPDLTVAVARALVDQELPMPTTDDVRHWVGNGAAVLVERALTWAKGMPLEAMLFDRAYAAFLHYYGAAPNQLTSLYPGARSALTGLRQAGYTLVLITNKPERFIVPILDHFGLQGYFTLCLGGDSLAEKKPSPVPLLHAAQVGGVAPDACVMVGDSRHDIAAGKAAGFVTLALPYGYNHGEPIEESRPDAVIASLAELIA